MFRLAPRDLASLIGFAAAARGLPWVLCHRRSVPPEVERLHRLMDAVQMASEARRYVSRP